ncbi:MAG: galactokinase [Saprospiraceae bacterium]|nr:galactokinase [Saprospiraceae bacterium]
MPQFSPSDQAVIAKVQAAFESRFAGNPQWVRACGRINIIGEHTDYNDGFVLPAAVDKYLFFAMAENGTDECRFLACDINEEHNVRLNELTPGPKLWANYLMGIIKQFVQDGKGVRGFDCAFGGNLPIGSGMSSSAALECGLAWSLNTMFDGGYSREQLAQLAQRSSHTFVGIPCGIMDQFASLMGKENQLILLDCRSLDYAYIPFDTGNYRVVLLNSKVHHELASSAYSTRVKECREAAAIAGVKSLRELNPEQLEVFRHHMSPTVYNRASYVVAENNRVMAACAALRNGDIMELGRLMFETHDGLRYLYEVSCPEIDLLVDFAKNFEGVIGARVMGGGFGGCTINLVHKDVLDNYIAQASAHYLQHTGIRTEAYFTASVNGTELLAKK